MQSQHQYFTRSLLSRLVHITTYLVLQSSNSIPIGKTCLSDFQATD